MKLTNIIYALPFALLTACGGDGSQNNLTYETSESSERRKVIEADLAANKAKWALRNLQSYQYEYKVICFCITQPTTPTQVRVSENIIAEAFTLQTSNYLPQEELQTIKTVDELFKIIDDTLQKDEFSISVTYNAEYGYPEKLALDYHLDVADDEVTYVIKDLM